MAPSRNVGDLPRSCRAAAGAEWPHGWRVDASMCRMAVIGSLMVGWLLLFSIKRSGTPMCIGRPRGLSMAISEIRRYAHLSAADIEAFGSELDAIRRDIEDSRGGGTPGTSIAPSPCNGPSMRRPGW